MKLLTKELEARFKAVGTQQEVVDDVHNVYERFNEWLTKARKVDNLE